MSDGLFFAVSKVFWHALRPDNLLVLALVVALWRASFVLSRSWKHWNRGLALFLISLTFVPLGDLLLLPLERYFPLIELLKKRPDGIIVLSGGVTFGSRPSQIQINESADRDIAFIKFARIYPEAKLVYSGGSSSLINQKLKGADAASQLMRDLGFNPDKIYFERDSRNTYESAIKTKEIINPSVGENWILITSAYHMPRAFRLFCEQGWPVQAYPVDFLVSENFDFTPNFAGNLERLILALKEWLGLVSYRMVGKITTIFSKSCGGISYE